MLFRKIPVVLCFLLLGTFALQPVNASSAVQEKVVFVGGNNQCTETTVKEERIWSRQISRWNDWKISGTECFSASFLQYPKLMSIGDYASRVAKLKPDVLVISAGATYTKLRSDQQFTTSYPVFDQLSAYRKLLPRASIVVIGPWSPSQDIPTLTRSVHNAAQSAAKRINATYIPLLPNNELLRQYSVRQFPVLNFIGQTQLANIVQTQLPKTLIAPRKTALFIGDSYTYGAGSSEVSTRWTSIVARSLNMNEVNFGIGGVGYLRAGTKFCDMPICPTYTQLLPNLGLIKPDFVFVAGGQNDQEVYGKNPSAGKQAILDTFTAIKAKFPSAKIIVVCPSSPLGDPTPTAPLKYINQFVNQGADSISATKVQLLFPSVLTSQMIGPDKIHPNDAGHKAIAAAVLSVLAPK